MDSLHDTTQRTILSPGPPRPAPRTACVVVIHGEGLGRRADIGEAVVYLCKADNVTGVALNVAGGIEMH